MKSPHITRATFAAWIVRLLLGCLAFAAPALHAATYAYRADVFAYDTPSVSASSVTWHTTSPSPACTDYPNGDDDWADVAFTGGFTFTFGGTSYSSVRVYSNGMLAFGTDVSGFHRDYTSQALPITAGPGAYAGCVNAVPQNLMVVYWLDIVAGTANSTAGAAVKYELLGTAPNRRFVISWDNVKLYNTTTRYNFQVQLLESAAGVNGNFKYQYTTGSSTGANAAVGVQLSTTDYTQYAYNQNFIDTTVGTAIQWYPANQLAGKRAEYRFDESSWTGAVGEVKDTSGNTNHASRTTANVANVAGGKLCRGATFTNNTSNATIDAIATPLIPASQGSVDFWYKSNTAWNAGGSDAMLLDATTVAARPFFLMKMASGALRFVVTDSAGLVLTAQTSTAYTYAASTWHHIGVSWSLKAGTNQTVLQIMLDGVLATTNTTTPYRTTSSGTIATLSTLYVGDNRTSGVTPSTGSPNGANGTIDEVYVYTIDINATQEAADAALTRTTCTTFDHFHIVHTGEVVNCGGAVANVTIEAHDASHALFTLSGTTMNLSTSTGHGTWSSISTINPVTGTAGTGNASYTFANENAVVLGLANTFNEALNINLNSGGVTESTGAASSCVASDYTFGTACDANLVFSQAGFLFNVPNHIAETSQSFSLKAVKKSDSSNACVPLFASGSKNITFTCSYTNPTTGTLPLRINGQALNSANNAAAQCDGTGQTVSLPFDASGVASPTLLYADVGNAVLTAQYTAAGVTMSGTDGFITAPKDFAFSAITPGPIKAGNNFSAKLTARNNAGNVTPNFGKETAPEGATVLLPKYQPTGTGAVNGTFTGTWSAFSAGNGVSTSANLQWTEVGTADLTASLTSGNYLGSGVVAASGTTGTTGAVGRFIPDHFDTAVTQGCVAGAFTYSGQPMSVQITAKNLAGAKTQNYDGSANTSPNFAKVGTYSDANAVAGTFTPATVPVASFVAGVATVAPVFRFTSYQTAPSIIQLRVVDSDNVSSGSPAIPVEGTAAIRYGRLRLDNAYGSELLNLAMGMEAQYWNGSTFTRNTLDTCTSVAPANINLLNYQGGVTSTNMGLAHVTSVTAVVPGRWNINLSKPSSPTPTSKGSVDVLVNLGSTATPVTCTAAPAAVAAGASTPLALSYLGFNVCGTTAFDRNPWARATFGIYQSPLIYSRENY